MATVFWCLNEVRIRTTQKSVVGGVGKKEKKLYNKLEGGEMIFFWGGGNIFP